MEETFEKRVRAAGAAAWWTVLIGIIVVAIQWFAYLAVVALQPAWFLRLWGPGVTWPFVQTVWFWGTAVLKLFLWVLAVVALWLTLWARQLRKRMLVP